MTITFWVDNEIDTLCGLQIDETSTSPAESPGMTDNKTSTSPTESPGMTDNKTSTSPAESPGMTDSGTWSDGDEEGEIARDVVAAGSGPLALSIVEQASHSQTCKLPARRAGAA